MTPTGFQELHESAKRRSLHLAYLAQSQLRDPDLKVTVRRGGFQAGQQTISMTIVLQCECVVPDDAHDAGVREILVIAYGQLGQYVRDHFTRYIDPELIR